MAGPSSWESSWVLGGSEFEAVAELTVSVNFVLGVLLHADNLANVIFFILGQRLGEIFPIHQ